MTNIQGVPNDSREKCFRNAAARRLFQTAGTLLLKIWRTAQMNDEATVFGGEGTTGSQFVGRSRFETISSFVIGHSLFL